VFGGEIAVLWSFVARIGWEEFVASLGVAADFAEFGFVRVHVEAAESHQ